MVGRLRREMTALLTGLIDTDVSLEDGVRLNHGVRPVLYETAFDQSPEDVWSEDEGDEL